MKIDSQELQQVAATQAPRVDMYSGIHKALRALMADTLVAVGRMDGADWITPEIALGKAWTAAAFRAPSDAQGKKAKDLIAFAGSISAATHGRYTPQIGGLPVLDDGGAVIGAIGASGGTGQQDEDVVRVAIG